MTALALILIVLAAFAHASWNWLAKRAAGGGVFVWLFSTTAIAIYFPLAVIVFYVQRPHLGVPEFVFIAGSSLIHVGYYLSLQEGYRRGDFSLVYPLARGTGPLLATVVAITVLGERPTPLAIGGALLIVGSVFFLTGGTRLWRDGATAPAMGYGVLTGLLVASYTVWDKYAVGTLLVPPLIYDWFTHVGRSLTMTPHALRHRSEVQAAWQKHRWEVIGVAVLSPLAYILVLTAMTFTPVSYVAPAREISIVIGTFIGAKVLSEGEATRRLIAATAMVLGVVALAIG